MTDDRTGSAGRGPLIRPGQRVWVGGHDEPIRRQVNDALGMVARPPTGPLDVAFVTPATQEECAYFLLKALARLSPAGRVWVAFTPSPTLSREAVEVAARTAGLAPIEGPALPIKGVGILFARAPEGPSEER